MPDDVEPSLEDGAEDGPEPAPGTSSSSLQRLEQLGNRPPGRARKPSWFDRPKPPHDWRWAVGGAGRVLISLGILMFLFVAYQLWGTGIQTAQAQHRLEHQFNDLLASTTSVATTTTVDSAPSSTAPAGPGPTSTAPAPTTVPAPPIPANGEPLALLEIPRIGLDVIVVEGVRTADLRKGPGHFPETPLPGQLGNAAIAGHRTTYGAPFLEIDQLQTGDEIIVTTLAGRYVYRVTGTVVISANAYASVIPTVDPTRATLVLVSCHPRYTARQRIVVSAELAPDESSPLSVPQAAAPPGTQSGETLPSESIPAESLPTGSVPDDSAPDTVAPPASVPAVAPGSGTQSGGAPGQDAFGDGWFADGGAWPQVALWGTITALVALGAYGVARLTRRIWVGALVGIAPFLFVLYFFFENVNRLLPPGI